MGKAVIKQKGNTLIVGLVLLLIFSTLGVASMSNVSFNQKMSHKFRDSDMTFHIAEAVLSEAEAYAETLSLSITGDNFDPRNCSGDTCFTSACNQGLCFNGSFSVGNFCSVNNPESPLASDRDLWRQANAYRESQISFPNVTQKPRYIIEFLCFVQASTDAQNPPAPNPNYPAAEWAHFFRITSYAIGSDNSSKAILQSTYKVIRE